MFTHQDEVPITVRKEIVAEEKRLYVNTRYQLQVRYRVNKNIGAEESVLSGIEKELTRIEKAIDQLDVILKELDDS